MVRFVAINSAGGYYFRNVLFTMYSNLHDNEYVVIDAANGDKYSRRMSFSRINNKIVLEALGTGYFNLNTPSNTYCVPYEIWKIA